MLNFIAQFLKTEVVRYLHTPNQEYQPFNPKVQHISHTIDSRKRDTSSADEIKLDLQGISIQTANWEDSDLIIFVIGGTGCHLTYPPIAQRISVHFESIAKTTNIKIFQFNPRGLNNDKTSGKPQNYTPTPLTQDEWINDNSKCAMSILDKYPNSPMIIYGYSLGGVAAKEVFKQLKQKSLYKKRIIFTYLAMSLGGIAQAFDYYQPSRLLRCMLPQSLRFLSTLLDIFNCLTFRSIQRLLKTSVEKSGWPTISTDIENTCIKAVNIKDDPIIPSQAQNVPSNYSRTNTKLLSCLQGPVDHEALPNQLALIDNSNITENDQLLMWITESLKKL